MKLGFFMMPLHPPEKSRTQCFEEDIEFVTFAEELGFSEGWIGQHISNSWEPIPSNDMFIAYLIARTKRIRLGGAVSLFPQHHPVNVAVRLSFLDHLSRGRLNCAFGQSGTPNDWELFDLPEPKDHGLMTVEGMEMVLKIWQADAPFNFQGKYWHIKMEHLIKELGLGELLKPYQKPHPPIGMSVIKENSMAGYMAGQRGYMPISSNLIPMRTVAKHWPLYCKGAQEASSISPDRSVWRISRTIFVSESNQEAWDYVLSGTFLRSYDYLTTLMKTVEMSHLMKNNAAMSDKELTAEAFIKSNCIVGDVSDCVQQLEALWDETGGFGTLLMITHDWDEKTKWLKCMDLMMNKVVPMLPTVNPTHI